MCALGLIGIIVIVGIVVCVQMVMVSAWSRETEYMKRRISALERRLRPTQSRPAPVRGKIRVTLNGETRVMDAEFLPAVTTIARRS